ncbi:MAG: M61 family metallopeptidase [Acidobacteria bacterium]|nr:M61 family metallopeptidase [Acidobacteriota bacterium]
MYQETPAQKKPKQTKETAAVVPVAPDISYTVSMSRPWTHLLEVEMNVKWQQMPDTTELKMPVWTPGSYLIREYERNVQDFAVKDSTGTPLTWTKTSKNTWAVNTKGSKQFTASYRVYANELTVRTNELNDEHAFWNNAATLFFIKGQLAAPATLKVVPANNWRIATGLPPVDRRANTFHSPNFDVLYDSPFEVSDFKEVSFDSHGKHHRVVISGEGNYDLQRIAADAAKIVDEAYKIFGEYGYDNYTFIVNLRGGGGLEHLNSTAVQTGRFNFSPESKYKGFLGLIAHEYFHNYNVKRIKPDALGPFDYETENYTRNLWVAEGGTEYYSRLLLLRAGFITPAEFLDGMSNVIEQLEARPGRYEQSLEDSSFDAWIKYYRPDENAMNNQISYYDKGELVNWLLDLTIRADSGGQKSLDDVMRYLWTDFFKKGRNYTPQDYQKAAESMAGRSLDDFFAKYVRGVAEIDYQSIVAPFGIDVRVTKPNANHAYIGADLTEDAGGKLTVKSVPANTPAYEQGINSGDQIVAIDGYRASVMFLQSYLADKKPGDKVRLTIFRFEKLRDFDFILGPNDRREYDFEHVANPTEQQRKLYHDFFNADL